VFGFIFKNVFLRCNTGQKYAFQIQLKRRLLTHCQSARGRCEESMRW
jgi:hypothetical protein